VVWIRRAGSWPRRSCSSNRKPTRPNPLIHHPSSNQPSQDRQDDQSKLIPITLLQFHQSLSFIYLPQRFKTNSRIPILPIPHQPPRAINPRDDSLSGQLTPVIRPVYVGAVVAPVIACFISFGASLLDPYLGVGGHGRSSEEMLDVFY
jgi:hypothetical protein